MRLLVVATRMGSDGHWFKTVHLLPHSPVEINRDVAGWNGSGAGMSDVDLQTVIRELDKTAANIHSLTIELVSE